MKGGVLVTLLALLVVLSLLLFVTHESYVKKSRKKVKREHKEEPRKLIEPANPFQGTWSIWSSKTISIQFKPDETGQFGGVHFTYTRDFAVKPSRHIAVVTSSSDESILPLQREFSINPRDSGVMFSDDGVKFMRLQTRD